MKTIDENMMLRFGSGELAAEEETKLLTLCEINPELWRSATLAVVEHRRVVDVLAEWSKPEETLPPSWNSQAKQHSGRRTLALVGIASLAVGLLLGGVISMAIRRPLSPVGTSEELIAKLSTQSASEPSQINAVLEEKPMVHSEEELLAIGEALHAESLISEVEKVVLNDHGFQIEETPELYVVQTDDGTQWAVPAQRTTMYVVKQ